MAKTDKFFSDAIKERMKKFNGGKVVGIHESIDNGVFGLVIWAGEEKGKAYFDTATAEELHAFIGATFIELRENEPDKFYAVFEVKSEERSLLYFVDPYYCNVCGQPIFGWNENDSGVCANCYVAGEDVEMEPDEPVMDYRCQICGTPITAAEADDNGGLCGKNHPMESE